MRLVCETCGVTFNFYTTFGVVALEAEGIFNRPMEHHLQQVYADSGVIECADCYGARYLQDTDVKRVLNGWGML